MDPAAIFLAVLIILLVGSGITLTVTALRRSGVAQIARKPLPDGGQHVAEQVWRVREVSESPLRDLVGGVAAGLVRGLAAAPQLTDYPNVRRVLTASGMDHVSRGEPAVVNPRMRRVQEGIDRFLGRRNIGPAQDLLSRFGIGMSSEAGDLLDRMEDLGALVTPEYLGQLVEESDHALHTITAALQQLERELTAASRWETFRRRLWPSVGNRIAQDAVVHGRAVLLREHQDHRQLRSAVKTLTDADARLRGTVWALTMRDLPPGAITSPDLTAIAPALDSYLRRRPKRTPRDGAGDPRNP